MKKKLLTLGLLSFVFIAFSAGQDFVYQPVNPAFGGNYLNYSWLLQSANAQNTFEKTSSSSYETDLLGDFETTMNRQILGQLSRNLMQNYFGEELSEGQYKIGDYEIEVAPGSEGLEVIIFDTSTGDKTTVTVPYY
jgi:curli production assembly/transport component CsgF